jgi:KDO2-lipid IV(A) lauroyltransferase
MFVHRENRRHRIVMKTIPVEEFHEKPEPDQIKALTAEMTRHIELAVREHPSQWMWFHERWKTQALPSEPQNGNKSVSP